MLLVIATFSFKLDNTMLFDFKVIIKLLHLIDTPNYKIEPEIEWEYIIFNENKSKRDYEA